MKTTVKQAIQQKFEQHTLSADQLRSLMSHNDRAQKDTVRHEKLYHRWLPSAVVISVVALGIILHWMTPIDRSQAIANEVVTNHLHRKPMEVEAGTLNELRRYFTQLPIQLLDSNALKQGFGQLKGGRYCSIQGITAAQLRLKTEEGKTNTYYQAEYIPDVHGPLPDISRNETPLLVYAKGVGVYIWQEKGLIFAVTNE